MNWAIIGLGGAGKGHALRTAEVPELELVAGCDPVAEAREAFAEAFDVPIFESPAAMFAEVDIDGVTVAASSLTHAELTIEALRAGKHVLVEKPFATKAAEAGRMLEAAKEADRVVAPFHNRRFDPDFLMVREVLDSGKLGKVRRIHSFVGGPSASAGWRAVRTQAGGRLYDWGPHLLDQVLSLTTAPVVDVWGVLHVLAARGDADEYFRGELRCGDGLDITIEMSGLSYLRPMRWEVLGEQGTLQLTGNIHGEFTLTVCVNDGEPERITTTAPAERDKRGDGGVLIYEALVRHIRDEGPLAVTGEDALRVIRTMDAIRESAERGRS